MSSESSSAQDLLSRLAHEFTERHRRGERPAPAEYAARHPELAAAIHELFPALIVIEEFGSVAGVPTGPEVRPAAGAAPGRLGEYRILREVARGGMGIVYEAVQESLGRHVALKVLPGHGALSPTHLERFRREARAAAQLHHTNIVPVFGVGEDQGVYYYAMQFICGQGLDAVLHELRRLRQPQARAARTNRPDLTVSISSGLLHDHFPAEGPRAEEAAAGDGSTSSILGQSEVQYFRGVARVGVQVAEALAHAHAQGVLHRDIKPSNLLLDTQGGVWVTDFGLAKVEGSGELTVAGDIVGTIRYMAPERFAGRSEPGSDVYGLGLTLYEMLTLRPAFDAPDRATLVERILHEELRPPRRIDPQVPRDLETVVLKAVAKEPALRYQSAAALAEDLRRFLADRPILARRVRLPERFGRWCRRNPVVAVLSLSVLALLLAGLAGLAIDNVRIKAEEQAKEQALGEKLQAQSDRADEQQKRADAESERATEQGKRADAEKMKAAALERWRQTAYFFQTALSLREYQANNVARADETLDKCEPDLRRWEWHYLKRLCHSELSRVSVGAPDQRGPRVLSPDGTRAAFFNLRESVVLPERAIRLLTHAVGGQALAPGSAPLGPLAQLAMPLRTAPLFSVAGVRHVYDVSTGKEVLRFLVRNYGQRDMTFSADGKWLAACGNNVSPGTSVRIWNALTGEEAAVLRGADRWAYSQPSPKTYWGTRLLLMQSRTAAQSLAPAGGGMAGPMQLALDWQVLRLNELYLAPGEMHGVAFSPDGQLVAATDTRGHLQVWERVTGKTLFRRKAHAMPNMGSAMTRPAFSADGKLVATVCEDDGTFKLWDARSGDFVRSLWQGPLDKGEGFSRAAFSPKGKWVAATGRNGIARGPDRSILEPDSSVRVWNLKADRPHYVFRGSKPFTCLAFSSDDKLLAAGSADNIVMIWELATGREIATYRGHEEGVVAVAFTPDGKRIVSTSQKGIIKTWDATRAPERLVFRQGGGAWHAALSPDGRHVAAASRAMDVLVWDTATGVAPMALEDKAGDAYQVAFSPDGNHLAAAIQCGDALGGVSIWDARTGRLVRTLPQKAAPPPGARPGTNLWAGAPCLSLAYSPDGKRLASGGVDRMARVWDTATGKELFALGPHTGTVTGVAFSADGRRLVSASGGISWDMSIQRNPLKLRGDDRKFVPNLKVWDAEGKELLTLSLPRKTMALAISPDGKIIAVAFYGGIVRLYDAATGNEKRVLSGHSQTVRALAFSPDGKRLLSGEFNKTVKLWDAETGEEVLTLAHGFGVIQSVGFSRDGHKIVTASQEAVRVWDATPLKK